MSEALGIIALTIVAPGEEERLPLREWRQSGRALTQIDAPRVGKPSKGAEAELDGVLLDGTVQTAPLKQCLQSAKAALAKNPGERLALAAGSSTNGEVLAQLAKTIEPGQIAADQDTALIVQALEPEARIEELGEIATLSGRIPVWSIRL